MKLTVLFSTILLLAGMAFAQGQPTQGAVPGGQYLASLYNYGGAPPYTGANVPNPLIVETGNTATGTQTLILQYGSVTMGNGFTVAPLATNAPITVDVGANAETVTPSAVSCTTPAILDTCTVTATFSNLHAHGARIASGTFGAQEAVNHASQQKGNYVLVDNAWANSGGTTAMLNGTSATQPISFALNASFEPNATFIKDFRSGTESYWYGAPGSTRIAAPTALTKAGGASATLTTSTTGGSIATATTPRFTITCVDQFGGETAAADDSNANAALVDGAGSTNSYTITAAGVPATTGCVGFRLYVSASGGTTQTETLAAAAQVTGTVAPLCPLPACWAPATAILLTALPATTAAGPPQGTAAAATSLASAHTTVVNRQSGYSPSMLPFNDTAFAGFWPVTVTSATTLVAGFDVMGELQYPAGFFNTLGGSYRICGGGVVTPSAATVAGTWNLRFGPRENSAGTSGEVAVVPFGFVASNQWTAALSHFDFCTDVTVSTVGTSGVMEGSGTTFCVVVAAGNDGAGTDTCVGAFNAASTAFDLTAQGVVQLSYVQTAASWTLPQLRYMTIRRL